MDKGEPLDILTLFWAEGLTRGMHGKRAGEGRGQAVGVGGCDRNSQLYLHTFGSCGQPEETLLLSHNVVKY